MLWECSKDGDGVGQLVCFSIVGQSEISWHLWIAGKIGADMCGSQWTLVIPFQTFQLQSPVALRSDNTVESDRLSAKIATIQRIEPFHTVGDNMAFPLPAPSDQTLYFCPTSFKALRIESFSNYHYVKILGSCRSGFTL